MDLASHDVRTLERMARRRRRTWLAAIVGNLVLVVVLVGGPWLRGRHRALEARAGFGTLAACLWDGTPDPRHGLTLPVDDRAAYADASRDAQWPLRCLEASRFTPEPVFWLFPDTRVAEADVVRAARVVAEEIEAVRPRASVASRPRLAMLRLSAALAVYSEAADAFVDLDAPAIELSPPRSVMPERVPVHAAEDAWLEVYPHADGVEMVARDARGLSWVRVRGGRHESRRLRRPSTLRGTFRDGQISHLLWWTDPDRCAPECAHRAMGWARLDDTVAVLPKPRWVGAHPVSADAFALRGSSLWVVALGDSEPELRRFDIETLREDEADPDDAEEDAEDAEEAAEQASEDADRPAPPIERRVLPGALEPSVDAQSVWWTHAGTLWEHRHGVTRARGSGEGWVRRVGDWVWVESGEVLHAGMQIATMPGSDDVELIAGRGAWLFMREGTRLSVSVCADTCGPWSVVHAEVDAWDATLNEDRALVAYSVQDDPAIRVREVDESLGPVTLPAPCFDTDVLTGEPSGMCGRPTFGSRDARVFLVAREGADAWVIEREDGPWRPLRGLR